MGNDKANTKAFLSTGIVSMSWSLLLQSGIPSPKYLRTTHATLVRRGDQQLLSHILRLEDTTYQSRPHGSYTGVKEQPWEADSALTKGRATPGSMGRQEQQVI